MGNSNIGKSRDQWVFVIGATHPHCYCRLFRESDNAVPTADSALATDLKVERKERLQKSVLSDPDPKLRPDDLFEGDLSPHQLLMVNELKGIFGNLRV